MTELRPIRCGRNATSVEAAFGGPRFHEVGGKTNVTHSVGPPASAFSCGQARRSLRRRHPHALGSGSCHPIAADRAGAPAAATPSRQTALGAPAAPPPASLLLREAGTASVSK